MKQPEYVGRFAPSPTGRLHFGSLVAAVASFAQARALGGRWLVRMEDLDPPRERAGAAQAIISDLAAFGMVSDLPVLFQSTRADAYAEALSQLDAQGLIFACGCSRKQLAGHAIYPGTCSKGLPPGASSRTLRVRCSGEISFHDKVQGPVMEQLERDAGAFVVRRADGLTAYQLAVVVDDGWQGVTEVVRGSDLLDSTGRQIFLQRALGLPTPEYAHLPIAINDRGNKLSKQTGAPELDPQNPLPLLVRAWQFLGQSLPPLKHTRRVPDFWGWAVENWQLSRVPGQPACAVDRHLAETVEPNTERV